MEVSIHRSKPDVRAGARLLSQFNCLWLVICLMAEILGACSAFGYTVGRVGSGSNIRLRADDISQGGTALGTGREQVFGEGAFNASLSDFEQPLDVSLTGALNATMTASVNSSSAFVVRLTNSERRDCVGDDDLDIQMQVSGPVRNAFTSTDPGGGELRIFNFRPQYQGRSGQGCPSRLFYGYALELNVEGAVASGRYEGIVEVTVNRPGVGGSAQTIQLPLSVQMPGVLLLYHHSQINVDLQASAIAAALGARSACGGGHCLELGSRTVSVNRIGAPIAMDVGADLSAFVPVQTITLRNAVGVRATGCTGNSYDTASYQIINPVGGIRPGSGVIGGIESQSCGLALRTGDLTFDLDLSQADATANATATIQITVTGL